MCICVQSLEQTIVKRLITTTMDNLKTLHFVRVDVHDMVQIQYIVCLIRSSPNLQNLFLTLVRTIKIT